MTGRFWASLLEHQMALIFQGFNVGALAGRVVRDLQSWNRRTARARGDVYFEYSRDDVHQMPCGFSLLRTSSNK
jgi:hypothetical protein